MINLKFVNLFRNHFRFLKKRCASLSLIIFIPVLSIILIGCKDNPTDNNPPCGGIDPGIVPAPPYNSPVWHPSGKFIGFNHTPLRRIDYPRAKGCWGEQHFDVDSTGFWLINSDGTNMRRIFPYRLQTPTWSPNGEWIAFVLNMQIYKMKFTGAGFDTASLTQLASEGRNFFPDWSPDGEWIVYDSNINSPEGGYRIWKMKKDGTEKSIVTEGRMPCWSSDQKWIYYIGLFSEIFKIGSKGLMQMTHLKDVYATENKYPKNSPNGSKIAFWSNNNIWLIDSSAASLRQITTQGVDATFGIPFIRRLGIQQWNFMDTQSGYRKKKSTNI